MTKVSKKHGRQKHNDQRSKRQQIMRRAYSKPVIGNTRNDGQDRAAQRKKANGRGSTVNGTTQQQLKRKVPFVKGDRVLLVGEGDFSFTRSLVQNYSVESILATSYDSRKALFQKYPHARQVIDEFGGPKYQTENEDKFQGFSPSEPSSQDSCSENPPVRVTASSFPTLSADKRVPEVTVYHDIDATKLSTMHRKLMRLIGPFTKIVFNFPHVGGLSTDINRQTRANQKLIQGFFGSAKPFLASDSSPTNQMRDSKGNGDRYESDEEYISDEQTPAAKAGQILVTLFEGEAYTDWNIRDIARDQGLKVVESFRFPWEAYPGYHHARTIGDIKTGKDRSAEGKRKGAWRGEERPARCFVFEIKDGEEAEMVSRKRKRKAQESGGNDESD